MDEDAEFGKQVARFFSNFGGKKKPAEPEEDPKGKNKPGKKR